MNSRHLLLALGLAASVAAACSKREAPSSGTTGTTAAGESAPAAAAKVDPAAAMALYQERCSACHGASGKGDGPGAAALTPKPRNYGDKAWQAQVTDEQIKKAITMGGAAVGKSPIMPASPDLDGKPEVLDALVKVVRKFGS